MLFMPEITEAGERMLQALREHGDWLSRSEIADKLGKNRLNPSDVKHLEGLVSDGLVERDSQVVGIASQFVYRSTS